MDLINFFKVWISVEPPVVTQGLGRAFIILFILMFFVGMVLRAVRSRRDKEDAYVREMFRRMAGLLTTMGILGVILGFFGFENVRFLGGRFWYPVWVAAVAIWAFLIFKYIKKQVPMMKAREKERAEKLKYMPKPKRR